MSVTLLTTGLFCCKNSESAFATVHEGNQSNTVFLRLASSLYRLLLEKEFISKECWLFAYEGESIQ